MKFLITILLVSHSFVHASTNFGLAFMPGVIFGADRESFHGYGHEISTFVDSKGIGLIASMHYWRFNRFKGGSEQEKIERFGSISIYTNIQNKYLSRLSLEYIFDRKVEQSKNHISSDQYATNNYGLGLSLTSRYDFFSFKAQHFNKSTNETRYFIHLSLPITLFSTE